jgi:hypothetical protein
VQYNGDVSLMADLGEERAVETVELRVYQRNGDFEVASIQVFTSSDGKTWKEQALVNTPAVGKGSYEEEALPLTLRLSCRTRHVRSTYTNIAGESGSAWGVDVLRRGRRRRGSPHADAG